MNLPAKSRIRPLLTLAVLWNAALGVASPAQEGPGGPAPASPSDRVDCRNGVVVSVSGPASDVGVSILKQGGNAVDAAVATAFALAVAHPRSGNLGGGGFMLIHPAPGRGAPVSIDYRECAPAAAHPTMYAEGESQHTRKAVAVPGTIRGLELAHRRFGSLPWPRLLQPAIVLASDGFLLDPNLVDSLNVTLAEARDYPEFRRVLSKPGGGPWKAGDRLTQPDLARTIQVLADQGPDAFYEGPIAAGIVAEMKRGGGLITARDLANYRAIERKPLTTRYRGAYDIYVPPPPSSGGVCLIQELHMLEEFDLKSWGRWSPKTLHVMAEAMRRANYDRALYLGDPDFTKIPDRLTRREDGHKLAKTIDQGKASRSQPLPAEGPTSRDGGETTHFSIIDRDGMAVANTYTLERHWGSRIIVKGMGFLLNNDMWAFNHFPGRSDDKGMIGTAPNTIAPGKRPITSQTPTIVAKDGRVKLVTGSPGSRAIPHTILGILVSVLDFAIPLQAAVEAPRFSHQWFPDVINFEEPDRYPALVKPLIDMGHAVIRHGPLPFGDAHSIWVKEANRYVGVADGRINGKASGY